MATRSLLVTSSLVRATPQEPGGIPKSGLRRPLGSRLLRVRTRAPGRGRAGEPVRKVFEVLLPYPDGLPAKEVLPQVESGLTLSEFERSGYPKHPGVRRFEHIVLFSTIAPVAHREAILKTG